jgi:ribosomal protein S15P/S13E
MDQPEQIRALLEEIRDLQKEHLAEYRKHATRSIELAEAAVAKQAAIGRFYKRVVFAGAILLVGFFLWLLWAMLS